MELIEKLSSAIKTIEKPDENILDLDMIHGLLKEAKEFVLSRNDATQDLSSLKSELSSSKERIAKLESSLKESESERESNLNFIISDIRGKMRLLGYPSEEINSLAEIEKAAELFALRKRIYEEFDRKYALSLSIPEQPAATFPDLSLYRICNPGR